MHKGLALPLDGCQGRCKTNERHEQQPAIGTQPACYQAAQQMAVDEEAAGDQKASCYPICGLRFQLHENSLLAVLLRLWGSETILCDLYGMPLASKLMLDSAQEQYSFPDGPRQMSPNLLGPSPAPVIKVTASRVGSITSTSEELRGEQYIKPWRNRQCRIL